MEYVIHSPPRTGGFSCRSFLADDHGYKVHHAHYLHNPYYYQDKHRLRNRINLNGKENFKIICTIRDPIARNLSEYWRLEYIDRPEKPITAMRVKKGLNKKAGTDEEKFSAYIDHYRQHHFLGSEPLFWGVNVFQDWQHPYTIWEDRFLLIRCEDLNEYGEEALSKLVGKELYGGFPIKNVVPTDRATMPLSEAYIDAMYQDEHFPRWFYGDEEISRFKERWKKTTPTGRTSGPHFVSVPD